MKKTNRIIAVLLIAAMLLTSAVFAAIPFTDVDGAAWYYDAVGYVYDNELMVGTSGTVFSPMMTMSRAMVVTVLCKMADGTPSGTANPFGDVPADKWYTPAVLWAYENGVAAGTPEGKFLPDAGITRQDAACLILRFLEVKGITLPQDPSAPAAFSDADKVAPYAKDAVEQMRRTGLSVGDENARFLPQRVLTRAEAAVLLMNLHKLLPQPTEPTECSEPTEPSTEPTEPSTEPTEPQEPDWITVISELPDNDGWLPQIP